MNYAGSYHEQQRREIASQFLWPILLGLIWICMVALTNPVGDFPLNDDWAYGYSVRRLLEQGQLRFSDWTGPNLFGQVLWGLLFCLPFGFSFTALRLSTAVLGLVGVLATYGILRELKTSREIAAIAALILACSPIYFVLSLTFMTDVPFTAFAIGIHLLLHTRNANRVTRFRILRSICDNIYSRGNSDNSEQTKREIGFRSDFASYRNSYPVSRSIRCLFRRSHPRLPCVESNALVSVP